MKVLKKLLPAAFVLPMIFGSVNASALTPESINFFHTIANNVNLHLNLGNKNIASKFCVMFMTTPLPDPDANNHRQRLYNLCSIAVWNSLGSPRGGSGAPVMIPLFRLTF